MTPITKETADNALSYEKYRELIEELITQGKTTGLVQSNTYIEYTKLNKHRMNRIERTMELLPEIKDELERLDRELIWIVITEAWCGDAANIVPVIYKIASGSPKINLKLILRDDNIEIMDYYHTNGTRSIPKLICLDGNTFEEIGTWGPRPAALQNYINEVKSNPDYDKSGLRKNIQMWYFNDKTREIQREIAGMVRKWRAE
jgi:hypothetical protein